MIDRLTGISLTAVIPSLLVIAVAAASSPSQAVDGTEQPATSEAGGAKRAPTAEVPSRNAGTAFGVDVRLDQVAPALPQIINLALLDPRLASQLVPDAWLDSAIEGARLVAGETPRARRGPLEPATWPVGPWSNATSLAASIRDLDPAAAAALFGALRPRIEQRCALGGGAANRCEQEMRTTLERLVSPVVSARLAGRDADPITDTQLEFARLGHEVVGAGHAKITALHRAVWPAPR
ncbi:MAG: hypothetical protein R3F35_10845 [Myxococcota bacterium]